MYIAKYLSFKMQYKTHCLVDTRL